MTRATRVRGGARASAPRSAGPSVADRSCGTCTLCCRVLEIQALDKPAGILCRHNTGTGCGIYPERPEACARWHCLWRRIDALPDTLRPDRSGVMFSLESRSPTADAPDAACIVGRAVQDVRDFDRPETVAGFAMFVDEGSFPVWKVSERGALLVHPGPQTVTFAVEGSPAGSFPESSGPASATGADTAARPRADLGAQATG